MQWRKTERQRDKARQFKTAVLKKDPSPFKCLLGMREPGSYLGTPVQAGGIYKHLEERTGLDLGAARRLVTGAEGVRGNEIGTNCYHIIHKGKTSQKSNSRQRMGEEKGEGV